MDIKKKGNNSNKKMRMPVTLTQLREKQWLASVSGLLSFFSP